MVPPKKRIKKYFGKCHISSKVEYIEGLKSDITSLKSLLSHNIETMVDCLGENNICVHQNINKLKEWKEETDNKHLLIQLMLYLGRTKIALELKDRYPHQFCDCDCGVMSTVIDNGTYGQDYAKRFLNFASTQHEFKGGQLYWVKNI